MLPAPPSPIRLGYLFSYNVFATLGWLYIDAILTVCFFKGDDNKKVWAAVAPALKLMQTSALLEVAHAALGLVRSSPLTAFVQGARARGARWRSRSAARAPRPL